MRISKCSAEKFEGSHRMHGTRRSPPWLILAVLISTAGVVAARPVAAPVYTLKALINGDRACYVVLANKAGQKEREGAFELCAGGPHDASALIGRRVTFTTERAKITAAACGGNIDCGKSDVVDLIVTLTAAPEIKAYR